MRRALIVILVCVVAGAGYLWQRWLSPNGKLIVDGVDRTYTVYIPNSAPDSNAAVVFVLHGNPSKSWELQAYTGMNAVAREHGFIVVYPDALSHKWPFTDSGKVEMELSYFETLLEHVIDLYDIDPNKVYVSGISGGGIFSILIGQHLSERISGIGVVAGNIPRSIDRPALMPAVPTLLIHGTKDFLYPGRDDLYSVPECVEIWEYNNRCRSADTVAIPESYDDNTSAVSLTYECAVPFRYIRITDGGHHWPGANFDARHFTRMKLGNFCQEVNASEEIWRFMSGIN